MAGTLIVAVREHLLDLVRDLDAFQADPYGSKPHVTLGYDDASDDREQVFTQRARFSHEAASMRADYTARNETGTFELVIYVQGVDRPTEWSSGRAVELGAVVEQAVAEHRNSLGLDGLKWIQVDGDGRLDELYADDSTLAVLVYPIKYAARLD